METELLTLTASMTDVLQLGHNEAQELAETVQATASEAQEVCAADSKGQERCLL
jgi:hypothetical protein